MALIIKPEPPLKRTNHTIVIISNSTNFTTFSNAFIDLTHFSQMFELNIFTYAVPAHIFYCIVLYTLPANDFRNSSIASAMQNVAATFIPSSSYLKDSS